MAGTEPVETKVETPAPAPVPKAGLWANLSFKQKLMSVVGGAAVAAVGGTYAANLLSPTPPKVTAQTKLTTTDETSTAKAPVLPRPTDDIPPLSIPSDPRARSTDQDIPPVPAVPRELPSTVTAPKPSASGNPVELTIPTIPTDRRPAPRPADDTFRAAEKPAVPNESPVIRVSGQGTPEKVPLIEPELNLPPIPAPPAGAPSKPAAPTLELGVPPVPEAPKPGVITVGSDVPPIPAPPKPEAETVPVIPVPKSGAPKIEPDPIPAIPAAPRVGPAPKIEADPIPVIPVPKSGAPKLDVDTLPVIPVPPKVGGAPKKETDLPPAPPIGIDVPPPPSTKKDDLPPLAPVPMAPGATPAPPMIDPVLTVPMAPRTVPVPPTSPGIDTPRVSSTLVPAEAKKENYEEDWHTPEPGQPYSWISNFYYKSPEFAKALEAYNRDRRKAGDEIVRVPPVWVLEEKYPALTGKSASKESTTARPAGLRFDPVESTAARSPSAPPPAVPADEYRVSSASGESIREIARKLFGDEAAWRKIFDMNPDIDPTRPIPAGTTLRVGK